jgi:hypothetical protein
MSSVNNNFARVHILIKNMTHMAVNALEETLSAISSLLDFEIQLKPEQRKSIIPEPTARVLIPPGYLHPGKRKH